MLYFAHAKCAANWISGMAVVANEIMPAVICSSYFFATWDPSSNFILIIKEETLFRSRSLSTQNAHFDLINSTLIRFGLWFLFAFISFVLAMNIQKIRFRDNKQLHFATRIKQMLTVCVCLFFLYLILSIERSRTVHYNKWTAQWELKQIAWLLYHASASIVLSDFHLQLIWYDMIWIRP